MPDGAKWGPEMLEKRAKVGRLRIRKTNMAGDRNARLLNDKDDDVLPPLDCPHISGAEDHGIMIRGSQHIWETNKSISQAWWCEPIPAEGALTLSPRELQAMLET